MWLRVVVALGVVFAAPRAHAQVCPYGTLTITPPTSTQLPEGMVGVPYSQTVTVTGGPATNQYFWQILGTFPAGLDFQTAGSGTETNTIQGTPTTPGTYSTQFAVY